MGFGYFRTGCPWVGAGAGAWLWLLFWEMCGTVAGAGLPSELRGQHQLTLALVT